MWGLLGNIDHGGTVLICFNCLNYLPLAALSDVNKTTPTLQTLEMWMEGQTPGWLHPSPAIRWKGPLLMLDWMYCKNIRNVIPCQGLGHKLNWIYSPADLILSRALFCFLFSTRFLFPESTISKYITPNWSINWVLSKQISDSMNIN